MVGHFELKKNIGHLGTEEIPLYLMFKGKHQNNRAEDAESPQYEHYSLILSHASMSAHIDSVILHRFGWSGWKVFICLAEPAGLAYAQSTLSFKRFGHCFTQSVLYNNTTTLLW